MPIANFLERMSNNIDMLYLHDIMKEVLLPIANFLETICNAIEIILSA